MKEFFPDRPSYFTLFGITDEQVASSTGLSVERVVAVSKGKAGTVHEEDKDDRLKVDTVVREIISEQEAPLSAAIGKYVLKGWKFNFEPAQDNGYLVLGNEACIKVTITKPGGYQISGQGFTNVGAIDNAVSSWSRMLDDIAQIIHGSKEIKHKSPVTGDGNRGEVVVENKMRSTAVSHREYRNRFA